MALLSLFALASVLLVGCTEDSSTDTTNTVAVGPPSMEFTSPAEGACFTIADNPEARIPFVVKTSSIYLRSPGICGDAVQCGQLRLSANGKVYQRSTTNVIEWEIGTVDVADRYGTFAIEIAAVTDADKVLVDKDAKPLVVTRNITTAVSCEGAGGAGGAGGFGGSGGAGGGT